LQTYYGVGMNERIRKLQHRAMSLVLNGNDPDGDVEKMYIPAEFTKKFAELIVLECADLVEGFEMTQQFAPDVIMEFEASWVLKEQFGIEE